MPALPAVPKTLKVAAIWSDGINTDIVTRWYMQYTGSAPSSTQLNSMCGAMADDIATHFDYATIDALARARDRPYERYRGGGRRPRRPRRHQHERTEPDRRRAGDLLRDRPALQGRSPAWLLAIRQLGRALEPSALGGDVPRERADEHRSSLRRPGGRGVVGWRHAAAR